MVCEQRLDLAEYGQIDADLPLFRIPIQFFGPNPAGQYFACRFGDGVQAERKAAAKQKAVIIHLFQNQIQTGFVFDADGAAAGLYDADVPFGFGHAVGIIFGAFAFRATMAAASKLTAVAKK